MIPLSVRSSGDRRHSSGDPSWACEFFAAGFHEESAAKDAGGDGRRSKVLMGPWPRPRRRYL